jgi:hypothetical protein
MAVVVDDGPVIGDEVATGWSVTFRDGANQKLSGITAYAICMRT